MQDKEFDKLFKDRFEAAEVQPSASLWNNISAELEPKRKRVLPVYWMAAAVALIAVTIGLLVPKTEKIRLQASSLAVNDAADEPVGIVERKTENVMASATDKIEGTPLVIAPRIQLSRREKELATLQPNVAVTRPANEQPKVIEEPENMIPAERVKPTVDLMIANADLSVRENAIAETGETHNKGIRNVGDVVNFVVNKLDKRENKMIQFDTDDDKSFLTAINIGILKFNRKSDK